MTTPRYMMVVELEVADGGDPIVARYTHGQGLPDFVLDPPKWLSDRVESKVDDRGVAHVTGTITKANAAKARKLFADPDD